MYYYIARQRRIHFLVFALFLSVGLWLASYAWENIFIWDKDIAVLEKGGSLIKESSTHMTDFNMDKDINIDLHFLNNGYLRTELTIGSKDIGGVDFSGRFFIKGKFKRNEKGELNIFSGKLFSKELLLDSQAFLPVSMAFTLTKEKLEIENLRMGKSYALTGAVSLKKPYDSSFVFEIKRADIMDLLGIATTKKPEVVLGIMNGTFLINGPLANLSSTGGIDSRNGRVGDIEYDLATIRFKGFGPIINVVDSSVKKGKGRLSMEGYIDIRNIKKENLLDGLKLDYDMNTIVWDGWDISKKGRDELSMTKDITEGMSVSFKATANDAMPTYYKRENPEEMNLEYKMGMEQMEPKVKMRLKDNEEFVGIEHNVKF